MICCGIDPDLHSTSVAIFDDAELVHLGVLRVPKGVTGRDAVISMSRELAETVHSIAQNGCNRFCIEGQDLYLGGDKATKNPKSILALAQVAGIAVGAAGLWPGTQILLPLPREWKGQVPKGIHHARICQRLGWPYRPAGGKDSYCVPVDPPVAFEKFKGGDWKHLLDAIGLALWGAKQ